MLLPEKGYKRIIVVAVYVVLAAIGIVVFYKFLLSPMLAFLTAFVIVCFTRPIIFKLHKTFGISKKLTVILFNISLISVISVVVYFSFSRLISELVQFLAFAASDGFNEITDSFSQRFDTFLQKFSDIKLLSRFTQKGKLIDDLLIGVAKEFLPTVVQLIMAFFKFIPNAAIFVLLVFISLFYIGCDYENIIAFVCAQLTPKTKNTLCQVKKQFIAVCTDLFKAYFLITLITFVQLLVGFIILDIKYAVMLAIVISFVDMLPILGTGTVIIPWAIVCLINGNNYRAIGLFLLYGIITIIRQIIEPKIVGASIGLHPLVALMAMYCGLKIMGVTGLFVLPVAVMIIKSLNDNEIIHLYNTPKQTKLQRIEQNKKKYIKFHNRDKNN